jgi:hypothetical protein
MVPDREGVGSNPKYCRSPLKISVFCAAVAYNNKHIAKTTVFIGSCCAGQVLDGFILGSLEQGAGADCPRA